MQGAVRMWAKLVLVCSVITVGYSYKRGAPVDNPRFPTLCIDMTPNHKAEAQPNPGAFRVDVSRNCYCDKELIVTYNSLNQSKHIKGIFIQARPYVSNQREDVAVGEFRVDHDPVLKTLTCNSMNKSAASHSEEKKNLSRSFLWKYDGGDGKPDVKFYATMVIRKTEFWTFVESSSIPYCGADACTEAVPADWMSAAAPRIFQALLLLLTILITGLSVI